MIVVVVPPSFFVPCPYLDDCSTIWSTVLLLGQLTTPPKEHLSNHFKMKATTLATLAVSALLSGVSAKEIAPSELVSEIYDSGVIHKDIMARKKVRSSRQLSLSLSDNPSSPLPQSSQF